jgi:hypothetical protein
MHLIITGATLEDNYGKLADIQKNNLIQMLDSYRNNLTSITIVLPRHFENLPVNEFLRNKYTDINIKFVNKTKGALCTALLALNSEFLNGEILIAPADSMTFSGYAKEINEFLSSKAEAGTVFFEKDDNSWSYLRLREHSRIIEISEKRKISNFASTGFFMFRDVNAFLLGAEWALKNSLVTNGHYFTSGSLQSLIIMNKAVEAFPLLDTNQYKSFRKQTEI